MAISAIAIRQLDIKNIIIMPIATHINIKPINFFIISTDMREVVITVYAATGGYSQSISVKDGNSLIFCI